MLRNSCINGEYLVWLAGVAGLDHAGERLQDFNRHANIFKRHLRAALLPLGTLPGIGVVNLIWFGPLLTELP